jgi:ribose 5-phosphate isomerase B
MEHNTIHLGCDHAGVELKGELLKYLQAQGRRVEDHGTYGPGRCDYPDYAHATAKAVLSDGGSGVLICGSANGVCMAANKHAGIRAALCWNKEIAALARAHNDANIMCLPARFITVEEAMAILDVFIDTPFEGGRHSLRVEKIDLEQ